jgi:hypothetical protein
MTDFDETLLASRAENLVATDLEDEIAILDIASGHFLLLNASAARVWRLLELPQTFGALCQKLQEQFDVSADQCRADVSAFLDEMREKGVVRTSSAA